MPRYESAAHDREAAAVAAARVREQEEGIRAELQEQQQELSNQACVLACHARGWNSELQVNCAAAAPPLINSLTSGKLARSYGIDSRL